MRLSILGHLCRFDRQHVGIVVGVIVYPPLSSGFPVTILHVLRENNFERYFNKAQKVKEDKKGGGENNSEPEFI